MRQIEAKILKNERVAPGFYRMRVESPYLARNSKPGQFVEVKCSDCLEPLLRRPLGVHRITRDGIEMLYEVVGKGTELLSRKRSGDMVDIIGPLGNGFVINQKTEKPKNGKTILIAGGAGVAPLLSLAESLAFSVERIAYRGKTKIHVFIGACRKEHILCAKDFKKLGAKVYITTEDGSMGRKGFITSYLSDFLSAKRYPLNANIYACGPVGMLKAVAEIAKSHRIPCQVSLEERMACGIGVCLGCPVKVKTNHKPLTTNNEYKMVCKDGPVFDAKEIIW